MYTIKFPAFQNKKLPTTQEVRKHEKNMIIILEKKFASYIDNKIGLSFRSPTSRGDCSPVLPFPTPLGSLRSSSNRLFRFRLSGTINQFSRRANRALQHRKHGITPNFIQRKCHTLLSGFHL